MAIGMAVYANRELYPYTSQSILSSTMAVICRPGAEFVGQKVCQLPAAVHYQMGLGSQTLEVEAASHLDLL